MSLLRLGTRDTEQFMGYVALHFPRFREWADSLVKSPMGVEVDAWPIEPEYTREEERGFHLLLKWWIEADDRLTCSLDALKTHVLIAQYGAAKRTLPGGQEEIIPLRRTTSRYDEDRKRYVRKKLSVDDYAELIDLVYRLAAEDGIELPTLDPKEAA